MTRVSRVKGCGAPHARDALLCGWPNRPGVHPPAALDRPPVVACCLRGAVPASSSSKVDSSGLFTCGSTPSSSFRLFGRFLLCFRLHCCLSCRLFFLSPSFCSLPTLSFSLSPPPHPLSLFLRPSGGIASRGLYKRVRISVSLDAIFFLPLRALRSASSRVIFFLLLLPVRQRRLFSILLSARFHFVFHTSPTPTQARP